MKCLGSFKVCLKPIKFIRKKEVNEMIKKHFDDYAVIRRYLVDHGMLNREDDGSCYKLAMAQNEGEDLT